VCPLFSVLKFCADSTQQLLPRPEAHDALPGADRNPEPLRPRVPDLGPPDRCPPHDGFAVVKSEVRVQKQPSVAVAVWWGGSKAGVEAGA